jgi:hypothetical protein
VDIVAQLGCRVIFITICLRIQIYLTNGHRLWYNRTRSSYVAVAYNNLYYEVGNPLFEADGVDYQRAVLPPDPHDYLPNDLVVPYGRPSRKLGDNEPLTARDVRSALWLCAGDIRKAAQRLGVSPARLRAFVRNSPWVREELCEARERILDRAEQILYEALFSDDPKRRDSTAKYILRKSASGRSRLHALTEHLQLDPKADRPVIRWAE